MGRAILREKDIEFDIESGGNTSEEDASNYDRKSNNAFRWAWNGVVSFDAKSPDFMGMDGSNLELFVDKGLNHGKQKIKLTNPRKPPKPPLPPKGPSLDAGDQKFVKELAELALRKRARIKKMKAVRKMKAIKSSSSSSSTYTSLSAMIITIVFFLVIILHGIRSASSAAVGLTASPESIIAADEGLISVQYPTNFNTNEGDVPSSPYHEG